MVLLQDPRLSCLLIDRLIEYPSAAGCIKGGDFQFPCKTTSAALWEEVKSEPVALKHETNLINYTQIEQSLKTYKLHLPPAAFQLNLNFQDFFFPTCRPQSLSVSPGKLSKFASFFLKRGLSQVSSPFTVSDPLVVIM